MNHYWTPIKQDSDPQRKNSTNSFNEGTILQFKTSAIGMFVDDQAPTKTP